MSHPSQPPRILQTSSVLQSKEFPPRASQLAIHCGDVPGRGPGHTREHDRRQLLPRFISGTVPRTRLPDGVPGHPSIDNASTQFTRLRGCSKETLPPCPSSDKEKLLTFPSSVDALGLSAPGLAWYRLLRSHHSDNCGENTEESKNGHRWFPS